MSDKTVSPELAMSDSNREFLIDLWSGAVNSVRGRSSVKDFMLSKGCAEGPYTVIAIGKAASDMMLGAQDVLGDQLNTGLVLTKYQHTAVELMQYQHIFCHESAHPVPDQSSLDAGKILVDEILNIPDDHHVLMLISGGASSLVEVLVNTMDLSKLQQINSWGLNNGFDINEINYMRQQISQIKGGGLCQYFSSQTVQCLYISDVPEDNLEVIGSGLLYRERQIADFIDAKAKQQIDAFLRDMGVQEQTRPELPSQRLNFTHAIVADNGKAKRKVVSHAFKAGLETHLSQECIDLDFHEVADLIVEQLNQGGPGVYVWGGEPTVVLPENPGQGGRNQALALLLAIKLDKSPNISVLVAGTDGTDGPTDAAGAIVDGTTVEQMHANGMNPNEFLARADAYSCLAECDALFVPGPTGTNVMDLIIAYKQEGK